MRLEFYFTVSSHDIRPYMPDVPVLFPASSFVRPKRDGSYMLKVPSVPSHVSKLAADCGGFVATFKWGDYRYTPARYVEWLTSWRPTWSAMMDYCCEDEITHGRQGIVKLRQDRTTETAWSMWQDYRKCPWTWVPTIQGWSVADYHRHAKMMRPLIQEMSSYYGPNRGFRVGIGTLCRRAKEQMIRDVVSVVSEELPLVPLHLWGVKLGYLQSPVALGSQVMSVDSAAWNTLFYRDRSKWKQSGLTQRRYIWTVAMPAYRQKIALALEGVKQTQMFFQQEEIS